MIHQYKNNGYDIVLDVNSGAIHVVDDPTYDMISEYEGKPRETVVSDIVEKYPSETKEDIEEAYDEITALKDQKALFTVDPYENRVIDYTKRPTVVKAMCLNVAHACNLSCRYCFADEGLYFGKKAELMSFDVGKAALDFLIANSGHRRNLEVDFFGGEPTLNFDVVKQLVAYGRQREKETDKHFRFTFTTNGILLNDEIMDFANKEMDNVVMSIDGRKEVHDHMRPFHNGDPTWDVIVPKYQKFAAQREALGKQYYVRGTYTRYNLDFAKDILAMADLGFKQISIEPVVAPPEADYSLRKEDIPILEEQYDILAKEMVKRHGTDQEFNFFHFMIDLEGGPCVYKRLSGCGSGTEYVSVTPDGSIFPCHQFVGKPDFKIGDVWKGIGRQDIVTEFKGCNVYSRPKCRECFARFYCSGGCTANAYNFTGNLRDVYEIGCALEKKRIECAIMIKAACADKDAQAESSEKSEKTA